MADSYYDLGARVLELYGFLERHRALFDAHSVDFFTAGHWENVVPQEWQLLAQQLPPDEAFLCPRQHRHAGTCTYTTLCNSCVRLRALFLIDIDQCHRRRGHATS